MARYVKEEPKYTVLEAVAASIVYDENYTDEQFVTKYPNITAVLDFYTNLPYERAQEMIDTVVNGVTMRILKGITVSNFQQNLNALLQNPAEKITSRNYNILRYTPSVCETFVKDNALADLTYGSDYVGEVGKPIFVDLKILRCNFIAMYGFYVALASDANGNLYTFNPKEMLGETSGFNYKIKGKVKAHTVDKYVSNAKVTRLNYVKVLD